MKKETKYIAKHKDSGLFYVSGQGFTAECRDVASKLTEADTNCLKGLGFSFTTEAVKEVSSYAVNYIRLKNLDGTGGVETDNRNPSKRRFATFGEAKQHGSRFNLRVARKGDKPGSAGHIGFYVTETSDPVNAKVNFATGLTNAIE